MIKRLNRKGRGRKDPSLPVKQEAMSMSETQDWADDVDNAPATFDNVVKYLMSSYGLSEVDAKFRVDRFKHILDKGISLSSFTYFVGEEISTAFAKEMEE